MLETISDIPDLSGAERERFLANALDDCARLENGIDRLAETVYSAVDNGDFRHEYLAI